MKRTSPQFIPWNKQLCSSSLLACLLSYDDGTWFAAFSPENWLDHCPSSPAPESVASLLDWGWGKRDT